MVFLLHPDPPLIPLAPLLGGGELAAAAAAAGGWWLGCAGMPRVRCVCVIWVCAAVHGAQIVSALGPVYGRQPGGGFGYTDGMSPERVDAGGECRPWRSQGVMQGRARGRVGCVCGVGGWWVVEHAARV